MVLLFHPAFVHFPIAFYFLEMGLLIAWAVNGDEGCHRFAAIAFRWGYGFMLAAMLTGLLSAGGLQGISGKVATHFYSALVLLVFYTLRAVYGRMANPYSGYYAWLQIGGSVIGSALVALTAYYGGTLVYFS